MSLQPFELQVGGARVAGLRNHGGGPRVLAASVRDLDTLGWLLTLGVGAVTLRKTLLDEALGDAATIQAVAQFEEATRPGAPARGA